MNCWEIFLCLCLSLLWLLYIVWRFLIIFNCLEILVFSEVCFLFYCFNVCWSFFLRFLLVCLLWRVIFLVCCFFNCVIFNLCFFIWSIVMVRVFFCLVCNFCRVLSLFSCLDWVVRWVLVFCKNLLSLLFWEWVCCSFFLSFFKCWSFFCFVLSLVLSFWVFLDCWSFFFWCLCLVVLVRVFVRCVIFSWEVLSFVWDFCSKRVFVLLFVLCCCFRFWVCCFRDFNFCFYFVWCCLRVCWVFFCVFWSSDLRFVLWFFVILIFNVLSLFLCFWVCWSFDWYFFVCDCCVDFSWLIFVMEFWSCMCIVLSLFFSWVWILIVFCEVVFLCWSCLWSFLSCDLSLVIWVVKVFFDVLISRELVEFLEEVSVVWVLGGVVLGLNCVVDWFGFVELLLGKWVFFGVDRMNEEGLLGSCELVIRICELDFDLLLVGRLSVFVFWVLLFLNLVKVKWNLLRCMVLLRLNKLVGICFWLM